MPSSNKAYIYIYNIIKPITYRKANQFTNLLEMYQER